MRDSFDITIDVAKMLNVSSVKALLGVNGKIFQTERPAGRIEMTDIVVNALGITNTTIQKGSGNVNAYVPGISSGGVKVANQAGLMNISRLITGLIDEKYLTDYQTWIEDSPTIMQDTDGSYFVNIPFEYQAIQNYKNI